MPVLKQRPQRTVAPGLMDWTRSRKGNLWWRNDEVMVVVFGRRNRFSYLIRSADDEDDIEFSPVDFDREVDACLAAADDLSLSGSDF